MKPKARKRDAVTPEGNWLLTPTDEGVARRLAEGLGISPVTARVLAGRGIRSIEEAGTFLAPKLDQMHEPGDLADIDAAVERILRAVDHGEKILVYGDYDADGLCATALMKGFLAILGAEADVYIPSRLDEVYGLHPDAVEEIASRGVKLVITVDCGVTATREAKMLAERGIDLVVTDHHQPAAELPVAAAVVDPNRCDCQYPFGGISGVGVAYKVAWATAIGSAGSRRLPQPIRRFLLEALGLVAIGTVADVVDLRDENRAIASFGLDKLSTTSLPGLKALVTSAGLSGRAISSTDVAFKIAPRLNAAGRTGDPYRALNLLLTGDPAEAERLAGELERCNRERQGIQGKVLNEARARALELAEAAGGVPPAVMLASEGWHFGVVGIAAGQLAREFGRPVVLISLDASKGRGRGSARSVEGFALHEALAECSDLLVRYGGHAMAAGLTVEAGNVDALRERFVGIAARALDKKAPRPSLRIDAICPPGEISESLCVELERLGPFGAGNPQPVVATGAVRLVGDVRLMGSGGRHVSFMTTNGHRSFRAVGFGMGGRVRELDRLSGHSVEIAHRPGINEFRGSRTVELYVEDFRPAAAGAPRANR